MTAVLAVVAAAGTAPAARAQTDARAAAAAPAPVPWALWLTLPLVPSASTVGGGSAAVAVTLQRRRLLVSARVATAPGPPCTASDCWPDGIDLALLGGYASHPSGRVHVSGALGIGLASYRNTSGAGLSGEVQASWRATRFLGLGLYAWATSLGPQGGIGGALQLGRLR